MKNTKQNIIWALIITVTIVSCKPKDHKVKNDNKQQDEYTKVEIYCWCIDDIHMVNGNVTWSLCTSQMVTPPYKLIEPEYFLDSTSDKITIQALKRIFFDRKESSDTITWQTDARLVFLLKRNNLTADTLVFESDNTFSYNQKQLFTYSFHIIDSLERILKRDRISCTVTRPADVHNAPVAK
jgi:hypothetical protein